MAPPPVALMISAFLEKCSDHLRYVRRAWPVVDALCLVLSGSVAALLLRERELLAPEVLAWVGAAIVVRLGVIAGAGGYRTILRYSGLHAQLPVALGVAIGTAVLAPVLLRIEGLQAAAFLALEGLLGLALCGGNRVLVRVVHRWLARTEVSQRVIVYGAGSLGEQVVRHFLHAPGFVTAAIVDDGSARQGALLHGIRVCGRLEDLPRVQERARADVLVIAIRDLDDHRLRLAFHLCAQSGMRLKRVSGYDSVLSDRDALSVDDIAIEDLLRRPMRNLDPTVLPAMLSGKAIVVTGAGGSIGSELCRQVCMHGAARLVLIDHSEPSLYRIEMGIRDLFPHVAVEPVLLDVSHQAPVEDLFRRIRPDVVFHAAAYKHVPMVEHNPIAGVRNNVGGFLNVIDAAIAADVGRLVLVSTDKAVRPTNVMGATKRVCELILQNHPRARTKLCAVRFGNVLGSSGSVVPRFLEQIANGGPVTVTDPRMTRYFMLIPEAVELVLHAGALAEHGEIFILDMGEPVKIDDMARQLILMTGNRPQVDISIVYTGLRPGEKLYEELLISDAERKTAVEGITVARPTLVGEERVRSQVEDLMLACERHDPRALAVALRSLVPEWTPSERIPGVAVKPVREAEDSRRLAATGDQVLR